MSARFMMGLHGRAFNAGRRLSLAAAMAAALALAACGGGKEDEDQASGGGGSTGGSQSFVDARPANQNEATRFLTQASYGATPTEITNLTTMGYGAWIDDQMAKPLTTPTHREYWRTRNTAIMAANPAARAGPTEVTNSMWRHAIAGEDQLRQRVAFALSQIFVVSLADSCGADQSEGLASYVDMLHARAFGSYRELLEAVTLHPIMGCYLSHLKNQKEDPVSGRVPDENYAREIMQLFSIGLTQLNMDGTPKLGPNGRPLETYTAADVSGLAKVFTGFSWECPGYPQDNCFRWGTRQGDNARSPDQWTAPMRAYPQFHSTSEKRFLGVTIPPQSPAAPQESLRIALDTLTDHPNVAPFISRQMIQRLVTSNPSPAYVSRVANAFRSSGLNIGAMVKAILLDPEARVLNATSNTTGKVREPILRMTALLRAYGATSDTGDFIIGMTNNPASALGQSFMFSPSVFNFFRPGYTPPGTNTAAANIVSPEQQILHETSAAGYTTYIRNVIANGAGPRGYTNAAPRSDVQLAYNLSASHPMMLLADDPEDLMDSINDTLMYGTMPESRKQDIVSTLYTIDYRANINPTTQQVFDTRQRRLWSALLLTMASPEFQIQR